MILKFVKNKIFNVVLLLILSFIVSCSNGKPFVPNAPKVRGHVNKSALLYINKQMKNNYWFSSSSKVVGFKINNSGMENPEEKIWSQNIGELSASQLQEAFTKTFSIIEVVDSKPSYKSLSKNGFSYIIIPSIVNVEVVPRDILPSYVTITYKVEVYNSFGKLVYFATNTVKESGEAASLGKAKSDESWIIFNAVSNGVDKLVSNLVKSGKL